MSRGSSYGSSRDDSSRDNLSIYDRFLRLPPMRRSDLRDETVEFVRKSGLFRADNLVKLVLAGYDQLSVSERREFELGLQRMFGRS